jgi:hypothetical protein
MRTSAFAILVPDAAMMMGDPGTVVAVITEELTWQIMPDTREVGLPALSMSDMIKLKY